MSKKPPGRPPKPDSEKQTTGINIRMTQAERDLIDKAAGNKLGEWARGVLLRAAKRQLEKEGP